MVQIYCDGACSGNLTGMGFGGYAAMIFENGVCTEKLSGHRCKTTNNRMEMTAAITALRKVKGDIEIFTDSQYLVNGYEKLPTRSSSWFDSALNGDLWRLLLQYRLVKFTWIRGHSDNKIHNQVDRLARAEAKRCHAKNDMPTK